MSKSESSKNNETTEIEIDLEKFAMPIAMVISAIIISIPISLSIYFGLRDAGLGNGAAGTVTAAECDESEPFSTACLEETAAEIGLNTEQFSQCLANETYDEQVSADLDYGTEIGVQGTPALYFGENNGESMRGFSVGPSITAAQVQEMIDLIESEGIDAAADYWRESQLGDISSYETQLRDFYRSEGQTGDQLEATVSEQVAIREQEIEESVQVEDYDYGSLAEIDTSKGDKDAPAALMEFSDYECPYCQRFATGVGATLNEQFVETGEMLFVYRDFPLESIHPSARKAANAARCAGEQDNYFGMHDAIFGVAE
jgi:protein-disulfide isomerase